MSEENNFSEHFNSFMSDVESMENLYIEKLNKLRKLENCIAELKEDLRNIRASEKTIRLKNNSYLIFIGQQQDVIGEFLKIRDEIEILKQSLNDLKATYCKLNNKYKTEQKMSEPEIKQIVDEHLKEILAIKEKGHEQAMRVKMELEAQLNKYNVDCAELQTHIDCIKKEREETFITSMQKYKEVISRQIENILSLENENKALEEQSIKELAILQERLNEKEQQHQAEIETWKHAELNRSRITHLKNSSDEMSDNYCETTKKERFYQQSTNFFQPQNKISSTIPTKTPTITYQNTNKAYLDKQSQIAHLKYKFQENLKLDDNFDSYRNVDQRDLLSNRVATVNTKSRENLETNYHSEENAYIENENESLKINEIADGNENGQIHISIKKTKPRFPAPRKRKLFNLKDSEYMIAN
uniref:Uncharacterized protein n=1 Tax=Clastoptera arizonana TaxID=38151 RepID=A0A1B6E5Z9_9HEMI